MNQIVFLVTSVIYYVNNPLSYSHVRSVFSPEERAEQTVRTIQSIRSKVPHASVVLIEMGIEHAPTHIQTLADYYLYIGDKEVVREAVDGPYKGYGEVVGLLFAGQSIAKFPADYYFKMSGRYYLDEHFDISKWCREEVTAKPGPGWISTQLYGFPSSKYGVWRSALQRCIPFLTQGEALENTLWRLIGDFHSIERLGVSGVIAPWNASVSE